jgi:[acyl-carrier-protein] S-malonyltransferase
LLAVVCPGQGSQNPGMLKSWSTSEIGKQISEMASQISNLDINYLGSLATKEEISDTSIAQVLISVSTLISAELLNIKKINADKVIVSGHSVGEIS